MLEHIPLIQDRVILIRTTENREWRIPANETRRYTEEEAKASVQRAIKDFSNPHIDFAIAKLTIEGAWQGDFKGEI